MLFLRYFSLSFITSSPASVVSGPLSVLFVK